MVGVRKLDDGSNREYILLSEIVFDQCANTRKQDTERAHFR